MAKSIECPRCKGRVSLSFRGQTLDEALARHEILTHGAGVINKPAPAALAAPAPRRRIVRQEG